MRLNFCLLGCKLDWYRCLWWKLIGLFQYLSNPTGQILWLSTGAALILHIRMCFYGSSRGLQVEIFNLRSLFKFLLSPFKFTNFLHIFIAFWVSAFSGARLEPQRENGKNLVLEYFKMHPISGHFYATRQSFALWIKRHSVIQSEIIL